VVALMMVGGIWSGVANLALFAWALASGRSSEEAMTMTFVSLVLIQFFKAYNFRSDRHSVWTRPFANKWLNQAVLWDFVALLVIVYLPVLHEPFGTFSLTTVDWVIIVVLAFSVVPVLEFTKWLVRRGWLGKVS
jgi:Ca2+-transporting ATPase